MAKVARSSRTSCSVISSVEGAFTRRACVLHEHRAAVTMLRQKHCSLSRWGARLRRVHQREQVIYQLGDFSRIRAEESKDKAVQTSRSGARLQSFSELNCFVCRTTGNRHSLMLSTTTLDGLAGTSHRKITPHIFRWFTTKPTRFTSSTTTSRPSAATAGPVL